MSSHSAELHAWRFLVDEQLEPQRDGDEVAGLGFYCVDNPRQRLTETPAYTHNDAREQGRYDPHMDPRL